MNSLEQMATDPRLKENLTTTVESIAQTTQNWRTLRTTCVT